jgi:hypothetical protein
MKARNICRSTVSAEVLELKGFTAEAEIGGLEFV